MAKKFDFDKEKNNRNSNNRDNNAIEEIMQADFPLPKQAEDAKNAAFARIREMAAVSENAENTENIKDTTRRSPEKSAGSSRKKTTGSSRKKTTGTAKPHRRFKTVYKAALGMTAAAAVFSAVCITNPAFAENIPLVGNVFEQIGNSLGFYGDYSKYAKQLTDSTGDVQYADSEENQDISKNAKTDQGENQETSDKTASNESYSKTVDGTTVTLSEVYCNDLAMYLSMTIHTEDKFPDTFLGVDGKPSIQFDWESTVKYDYMDQKCNILNAYLDGKMLDENTYAGVLRIPVEDMTVDDSGWAKFYEVRNAFLKEKGIDVDSGFDSDWAQTLGMDEYSDEKLPEVGGPAISDYVKDIKVPDKFSMDLDLKDISGALPEGQDTTPDIPQDLWDEYNQKMAEHGISTDDADYEGLTEEQKDLEHQFFSEMWNEYYERYPDMSQGTNRYNSWTLKGDWKFSVDVEKNTSDTVEKDVNVVDENGDGVLSVTKTPFEITMKMQDPETKYVAVMLDANGDIMPYGGVSNSNADTYAIQDRDVSTVYIYLCDYYEYMDELKGYYYSNDYKEKAKTKTFKQLLDERSIASAEVHFK